MTISLVGETRSILDLPNIHRLYLAPGMLRQGTGSKAWVIVSPMLEGPVLLLVLLASVAFIVLATARYGVHAFLALMLATLGVGLVVGMPLPEIVVALKEGFGKTLGSIGVVILLGTILGVLLEKTGSALAIASYFLRVAGVERSPMAMSITGYIVGIPIFCDSGFVVLSPLNKALAAQARRSMATMAIALALPLFIIHCLIPPHPGPAAAAGILGADVGLLMVIGFPIGIPALIVSYLWAVRYASRFDIQASGSASLDEIISKYGELPSLGKALVPLLLPLVLIGAGALSQVLGGDTDSSLHAWMRFLGNPTIALVVGVLVALALTPSAQRSKIGEWVSAGVQSAGPILAITGAGGAFGYMLRATPVGAYLGELLMGAELGLLLPFLLAAALKTAQGSSTVAMITASSLLAPLLPSLGYESTWAVALVMMSLGAGSMVFSHANDSYYWVVSRFSGLDDSTAYRTLSVATLLAGLTTLLVVLGLGLVVL